MDKMNQLKNKKTIKLIIQKEKKRKEEKKKIFVFVRIKPDRNDKSPKYLFVLFCFRIFHRCLKFDNCA